MLVQPYLHFDGRCGEAIKFYAQAVGAQTQMLMRDRECPEGPPPGMSFAGFQLSLSLADTAEAEQRFAALAQGGQVRCRSPRLLFAELWHAYRPLRRILDGDRLQSGSEMTTGSRCFADLRRAIESGSSANRGKSPPLSCLCDRTVERRSLRRQVQEGKP